MQISPFHVNEDGVDTLYVWGITHGRFGGVSLAEGAGGRRRGPDAWQYFTGTDADGEPEWAAGDPDAATIVLDDTVGELSVVWNDYLGRWIMTYLGGDGIVIREGITPWGPWGESITLVGADEVPGPYSPYMLQRYTGRWRPDHLLHAVDLGSVQRVLVPRRACRRTDDPDLERQLDDEPTSQGGKQCTRGTAGSCSASPRL